MAQMVIILLPRARVCIRRMEEVLKTEPEGQDAKDCVKGNWDNTQEVLRFEDVNFRFSDAEEEHQLLLQKGRNHGHYRKHRKRKIYHSQTDPEIS